MLNKVLETSRFVVDNAKHVKINYVLIFIF